VLAHLVAEVGIAEDRLDARRQLDRVAGLDQQPGAGAVDELGEPTGAGDDERRAAGERLQGDESASRATMPNGSYSDGMTTTPARCTRSRRRSSDKKPGRSIRSLTPSRSICDCSSGR
jgi:hypothetical protein